MTKERLRNYLNLKAERAQIQALLDDMEESLCSPATPQLTGMPGASAFASGSAQERRADATMELRALYKDKIAELAAEQLAIEEAIESLDQTARRALRHRYIEGLTWEQICVEMDYSWRQIHRIHAGALETLRAQKE